MTVSPVVPTEIEGDEEKNGWLTAGAVGLGFGKELTRWSGELEFCEFCASRRL
jgi:hypothetical protein